MSYPVRLERDTHIVDWTAHLAAWCTTFTDPSTANMNVLSDGVLYTEYACMDCRFNTGVITATKAAPNGLHISGPEPGDHFTPYAVSVRAVSTDPLARPLLMMGESPASITSAAGGNVVGLTRLLAAPEGHSDQGHSLNADFTVVVKEQTADRGLCFFVAMYADAANSGDLDALCALSVRRLVGVMPGVFDTYKT